MKSPVPILPDLHTWAGQNLELPPGDPASKARAAFLRKLPDFQWVPPAALEDSQAYWSQSTQEPLFPSLLEQALPDEEFRLRTQVEAFAERYFDLDPAAPRAV